jgi:hypothetical protein
MTKLRISADLQGWIEARKRFRLSHEQVQMARELGMNPKKLGKLANHKQEPWKEPLPQFIHTLYRKRFGKERPDTVVSIEERARQIAEKKAANRQEKRLRENVKVGIACYLPEQWDRLREISDDADHLEKTHAEWAAVLEGQWAALVKEGLVPEKVMIDVNEIEAWCRARELPINASSRSRYAAELLRLRQQREEEKNGSSGISGCEVKT